MEDSEKTKPNPGDEVVVWTSWVECPRMWGIVPALSKSAISYNLKFEVLTQDVGWFREYVAFRLTGKKRNLDVVRNWFYSL